MTRKTISEMTYNVSSGMLNPTITYDWWLCDDDYDDDDDDK